MFVIQSWRNLKSHGHHKILVKAQSTKGLSVHASIKQAESSAITEQASIDWEMTLLNKN